MFAFGGLSISTGMGRLRTLRARLRHGLCVPWGLYYRDQDCSGSRGTFPCVFYGFYEINEARRQETSGRGEL